MTHSKAYFKEYKKTHSAEFREYKKLWNRHNRHPDKYPKPTKVVKQSVPTVRVKVIKPDHCQCCEVLLSFGGSGTEKYCEDCANKKGII